MLIAYDNTNELFIKDAVSKVSNCNLLEKEREDIFNADNEQYYKLVEGNIYDLDQFMYYSFIDNKLYSVFSFNAMEY